MKSTPFRFMDCPEGSECIKRLEQQFPRKTVVGDPVETYVRSCQSDVIDWMKRIIKEHGKPQAGETNEV